MTKNKIYIPIIGHYISLFTNLILVYDGSKLILYADGINKFQINASGSLPADLIWRIGVNNDSGENGRFGLDDFAIWESPLSPEEVTAVYNHGSGLNVSLNSGDYQSNDHLLTFWNFSDGSGTTIYDQSYSTSGTFNGSWDVRPIFVKYVLTNDEISPDASGKNWVAEYQVKDGDVVDGAMEFQITGFKDIVGNTLLSRSILTEDADESTGWDLNIDFLQDWVGPVAVRDPISAKQLGPPSGGL